MSGSTKRPQELARTKTLGEVDEGKSPARVNGATKTSGGLKTRDAILAASKHLFLRQGYHATGMREIAHEAGISLGAAYNHFTSKEEILQELLAQHDLWGSIGDALSRAQGETTAELLRNGYAEIMSALEGKVDFPLFLFIDMLEFQGRHVGKLVAEAFPSLQAFFQRVHSLGEQTGEMRDVALVPLARSYIGMIFSSFIFEIMTAISMGNIRVPLYAENWQQGMVDILLHGVLKESAEVEGAWR